MLGTLAKVVQVAPPSVVLATHGVMPSDGSPRFRFDPTTQQLVVLTQSIDRETKLVPHCGGVMSVQVWPPSVVSATAAKPPSPWPAAQQTEVDMQEMASY